MLFSNFGGGAVLLSYKELDTAKLQEISGGYSYFGGSNGYSWRDKRGHWHYTVTKGGFETVIGIIGDGWCSAGAPGPGQH